LIGKLTWLEIIGGMALPLASAAAQYWLLRADTVGPWLCWGYAVLGIIALLAAASAPESVLSRRLIAGANAGCAAGSLFCATEHLLFSYYFVWPVAVVALSVFPGIAASVNAARAVALFEQDRSWRLSAVIIIALGGLLTFMPPAALQIAENRWIGATMAQLQDVDANNAAAGLRALNDYPLRLGRFAGDVCEYVVIDRTDVLDTNQELMRQLDKMLGTDFWHCTPRDPHG
jgi:hypothetical protein